MNITSGYESKQCLQSANIHGDQDQSQNDLPRAKAWLIGRDRVAWECPSCSGLHLSGKPVAGDDEPRFGFCLPVFDAGEVSDGYHLDFQPGPAPNNIRRAIDQSYPFDDLAKAYESISGGRAISASKFAHHVDGDDEDFWVPSKSEFLFALNALRLCGALDEAMALRAELGQLTGRQLWRASASDFLRRQPGRSWRERLLTALRECWQRHGGPA